MRNISRKLDYRHWNFNSLVKDSEFLVKIPHHTVLYQEPLPYGRIMRLKLRRKLVSQYIVIIC